MPNEYIHNIIRFIGPTEPKDNDILTGDLWNNTKDNVICKRTSKGMWDCGFSGVAYYMGGASGVSTVDRLEFSTNTRTAVSTSLVKGCFIMEI
jgi:hypothetical protein